MLTSISLFMIVGAQAQDDQYTIIVKKSADWCPNCGGWAWPVFNDIREAMEDRNGIPILMHHTGGLANPASIAITDNLGGNYQPEFFLDNEEQGMTPNNAADKIALMVDAVDLNASLGSFMGIDIDDVYVSHDGATLSVDLTQEIYNVGLEGTFSVGVYLIQNNIMHNQAGQGNVLQPRLLTGSFTEEHFGNPVNIDANSLGSIEFSLSMEAPETLSLAEGDTEIVTIIWRWDDDGTKYVFNADNWSGEVRQLSNVNELPELVSDLKAYFSGADLNISMSATQSFDNAIISLVDVTGKMIYQSDRNIKNGENNWAIAASDLASGVYVLNVNLDGKQLTKKLIKN